MLNIIWVAMMVISVLVGVINGRLHEVILASIDSAKFAFNLAFGLTAIMCLWLGILEIAEKSGLITQFTRLLKPLLIRLFPDVPADHPAMGAMVMNFSANFFGLNNAATPFGLRAMEALEKSNPTPGIATDTMCTFVILHSSNLQLIPTGAMALLATAGATHPTDIIVPFFLSTLCALTTAIILSRICAGVSRFFSPVRVGVS